MAKTSPIVDRSCSPAVTVINSTPMSPVHAPANKYGGDPRVNTQSDPKMRATPSTASYPDYVIPKGQEL